MSLMDKLSYEIFSILENKFLFSDSSPATPLKTPTSFTGKVRIISIDGGGDGDGILAAASLSRLESSLQSLSGDAGARIADFFDVAAGSGTGGVLAAMLFTRGNDGRSLFSAEEALHFLSKNHGNFAAKKRGVSLGRIFGSGRGTFQKMFPDALTLRDAMKPVLIPCYDVSTGTPFLFSRADAMETDGYDFKMSQVCAATCAVYAVQIKSVDGRSKITALGGHVTTGNPTAAAITHVLNNKQEFPLASGVDDLLVISLGSGESDLDVSSATEMLKISGNGIADTVDQAVGMAFGHSNSSNYVRIQANCFVPNNSSANPKNVMAQAESVLRQRNVESVLFGGKKLSKETNAQKLEWFAGELIKEHERRKSSPIPTVVIKQATTPRTSTSTIITTTSIGSSTSP